ncbi:hypothetical protein HGA34_02680 [Candidatus Falkowbacteria bacterium]|nr:hypothetical protein [Candidatus Falkowbacteria bacterium]
MNSNNNNAAEQPKAAEEKIREVHHHHYGRHGFNFGRLLFGLIVIMFGLAFLARNAGWLPYDIRIDWSLFWPIVVILIGLSLMSGSGWVSAIIGTIVTVAVLVLIGLMFWSGPASFGPTMMRSRGYWQEQRPAIGSVPYSINREAEAKRANITLRGGAGRMVVQGGTEQLIEGKLESNFTEIATSSKIADGRQEALVEASGRGGMMMGGWKNDLSAVITKDIPVELTIDGGAASLELDLTRVIAESVKINTGASSVDLSLGDKPAYAKIDINAGASSVDIEVPKNVGVKAVLKSALTSVDLPGFDEIGDNVYATKDFDKADKKVELNLELGVSSVRVNLK